MYLLCWCGALRGAAGPGSAILCLWHLDVKGRIFHTILHKNTSAGNQVSNFKKSVWISHSAFDSPIPQRQKESWRDIGEGIYFRTLLELMHTFYLKLLSNASVVPVNCKVRSTCFAVINNMILNSPDKYLKFLYVNWSCTHSRGLNQVLLWVLLFPFVLFVHGSCALRSRSYWR